MNILALALLGIAKKIFVSENKSHGVIGHLLVFWSQKRKSFLKIRFIDRNR